jgi:anti-sigma factor RsiW
MREMACQELVEVVTDYLEGALPGEDRLRFEAHLADCEACGEYVAQIRSTIELVGHVDAETLSPELQQGLLESFRRWRSA